MAGSLWGRRQFLVMIPGALLALGGVHSPAGGVVAPRLAPHPDPRPGIDASRVLRAAQLEHARAAPVFDLVRQIPQVVDGIRCYCGCAETPGNYSLLSCYEAGGMAQQCNICQGQARLAHRLNREGWSLNGIRAAIDAEFGAS
ncbi:MAG TPA: PCYCGC motif-containing (lipo)protein [Gemmatimonadales bacterium]